MELILDWYVAELIVRYFPSVENNIGLGQRIRNYEDFSNVLPNFM